MREQLSKILDMVNAPNVTMQVVPFEAGAHPGLDNTFTLLEFDRSVLAPVVFIENLAGNLYLEREAEIERCREALEHLRACALSPNDSTRWAREMKKKLEESLHTLRKASECLTKGVFVVLSPDFSAPDISWRTAVKSGASNCVQVARRGDAIMIADSKNPSGPVLSYTLQEFDAFLDGAKKGEFDDFLN